MTSFTIVVVPANSSPADWAEVHRITSDAREAIHRQTGVVADLAVDMPAVANPFQQVAPAPAAPVAPVVPVPEFHEDLSAFVGDPTWLAAFVRQNGQLPANGLIEKHWEHILADHEVGAYVESLPLPGNEVVKGNVQTVGSFKHLRSAANMARGREIKRQKQAWKAAQQTVAPAPAQSSQPVAAMTGLAGLAAVPVPTAVPASAVPAPTIAVPDSNVVQLPPVLQTPAQAPVTHEVIAQYASQLTTEQRQAIVDWYTGAKSGNPLIPQNQAVLYAFLSGDADQETGQPVRADKIATMLTAKAGAKFLKMVTSKVGA